MSERLCANCGRPPLAFGGQPDPSRHTCWDCADYDHQGEDDYGTAANPRRKIPGGKVVPGYCDGAKKIYALPRTHPDHTPKNNADAHRIMAKHGIDPETGHWTDEKKKAAAMDLGKKLGKRRR